MLFLCESLPTGKLHKRSRSEDNIVQGSDNFTGEIFMTPQIMAQAMTKDDPHYCPASINPFASITIFKDGRKIHEFPRQQKYNGSNSELGFLGKSADLMTLSQNSIIWNEKQESQSLPSSPIMLRKAAEKLHQASLHGSDAVQTESQHELHFSVSSNKQEIVDNSVAADRRARFSSNRTRSLGSLDFWNSVNGPNAQNRNRGGKSPLQPSHSEKSGYCNRLGVDIRESSVENQLELRSGDSTDSPGDDESSFPSEYDSNVNFSMASNTYHSFNKEDDGTSCANPWRSCDESLSTGSQSSFVSCGDLAEGEEAFEVISDSLVSCEVEEDEWAVTEKKTLSSPDTLTSQVTVGNGNQNCNRFRKDDVKFNKRNNSNTDL